MQPSSSNGPSAWGRRAATWLTIVLLVVALLRLDGRSQALATDYIQFWSASSILLGRGNPYDAALQTQHNRDQGWDVASDGLGTFEFLPYYYPPWLGLALAPLVPLGFSLAKTFYLALLVVCVLASGWLLRREIPGMAPPLVVAMICALAIWWTAVGVGQTSPLVVLSIAASWRLADARYDRSAGWTLAWLTIKPQLTICLLVAAIIWAVRQRRFRILEGIVTATLVFVVASTWVYPSWLGAMLTAMRETPLVTLAQPGLGTTWLAMLRNLGLSDGPLVALYLLVALPTLASLVWLAWRPSTSLPDLIALASAAAFLVAPYARYYDLPLLIFPTVWLLANLRSRRARTIVAGTFVVLPLILLAIRPDEAALAVLGSPWFWILASGVGGSLWLGHRAGQTLAPTAS